jgi:hypothetical protein
MAGKIDASSSAIAGKIADDFWDPRPGFITQLNGKPGAPGAFL